MVAIYLAGAGVVLFALCISTQKSRKLSSLFVRFVVHYFLIALEDKFWRLRLGLPGPLPRNINEIIQNKERFEKILKSQGVIGKNERIVCFRNLAEIKSEPAKQATSSAIHLEIDKGVSNQTYDIDMFCKFQTGRGMPFWLQAIRAAAEPGVCREVDFYNHLSESVPVRTIKPLLALKSPAFNYVLVALQYIDLEGGQARVINDSTGATLSEVMAIADDIAKVHGRFLGADDPETSWIPAKRGLEYAQFVERFTNKDEKVWTHKLWFALKRYFANHQVTLVHGDCRPGNMMFEGTDRDNVEGVIFADWEATNVAPIMWDLTYCTTLGWCANARREHFEEVLSGYLESLSREVTTKDLSLTSDEARLDVALLTLVLGYVSRTVRIMRFWDNQGNTRPDKVAWFVRMALAINDLDASMVAEALRVDEEDIKRVQDHSMAEIREVLPDKDESNWAAV